MNKAAYEILKSRIDQEVKEQKIKVDQWTGDATTLEQEISYREESDNQELVGVRRYSFHEGKLVMHGMVCQNNKNLKELCRGAFAILTGTFQVVNGKK